jgi:hypothetical protein
MQLNQFRGKEYNRINLGSGIKGERHSGSQSRVVKYPISRVFGQVESTNINQAAFMHATLENTLRHVIELDYSARAIPKESSSTIIALRRICGVISGLVA